MLDSSAVRLILLSIILCSDLNVIKTSDENTVSVRIKNGLINGQIESPLTEGKRLHVFRGIPYAEPPVGSLRFKRPVPVGKWTEPLNAYNFESACHQDVKRFEVGDYFINKNTSEDCLYLNIWSPIGDTEEENNEDLKPVMVWIHGGGLLVGSPSEEYYVGDALAAKGDVVVVSFSYRLNIFGFLYTGTQEAPGNVGLWDQALALEWVNDNIKYFGGDPNRVTIFGESAGGWSTSLHIISPISRHLFRNAILNSGSYVYKFSEDRPEDHSRRWLKGVQQIGCSDPDSDGQTFTKKVMDCLRAIEPEKLVPITDIWEIIPGSVKVFDLVVTDGQFLPEDPNRMLLNGDFKRDVKIMVSTVEDEGDFLISNFNDPDKFHPLHPHNLSYSEAYRHLRDISAGLNSHTPINGEDVAKLYYSGLSDRSGFDLLRRTIGIAVGDYYLTCPTVLFAKEVFKNSGFKSDVYQYYFNSKYQDNFFCSHWMGVCHTNDIFPMFGIPFLDPDHYNDREREISEQMIKFLTDFVKTGNPGPQDGAQWPKYYTIDDKIIAPYYEIQNEPKITGNFKIGYKINECEYLWKKYLI